MFIEQAYKGLSDGWRYIIGFIIVFVIGWQIIGAIPIMGSAFMRSPDLISFAKSSEEMFIDLYEGENNLYLLLMLFTFIGGLIALIPVVKYLHKQKFVTMLTARSKFDWKRVLFAFGIWAAFSIITTLVAYYLSPESLQWNFNLMPFLGLLAIALLILPLQTSFEEFLFRGYLMQGIGINVNKNKTIGIFVILLTIFPFIFLSVLLIFEFDVLITTGITLLVCALLYPVVNLLKTDALKRKWIPLLFTSVIFGMMHGLNPEIEKLGYIVLSAYVGIGLFLGIITLMDDGMELALGFHAANNMIIALLVTSDWTALQTDSIFLDVSEPSAMGQIIPIFIILPILAFVFAKKYKWTNWKEKLTGRVERPQSEV